MTDAPQTEHGTGLAGLIAPVGRRVLGRHARLMRATGLRLGEAVAARHEPPEAAKAARRLAPVRLVTRAAATAAATGPPAAPEPAAGAWEPSATESTVMPGMSDWAAEYLFGDADAAVSTGQAWMGGAGLQPRTPEEKRLSRIKRGGPEVARAAKILEGDETPPPAGAKRLARRPAADPGVASDRIPITDNPTASTPPRPTVARTAEPAAGTPPRPTVARTASGTPASPPSEPAAGTPPRPTVARAASETPASPASEPTAGTPPRPTVASETPASPPSEPAAGTPPRPTVAPSEAAAPAERAAGAPASETPASPPSEPAAGTPPRPTVASETPAPPPSEPAAGTPPRPTVARTASETPAPPPSEPAAGTPARPTAPDRVAGETSRPTVARVARAAPPAPVPGGGSPAARKAEQPARVRVSQAAPARPAVQRVARPEPELVPVAPPARATPTPAPTLLRRIADRFRSPAPAAEDTATTQPPRAAVTRLARMDLQPTAPGTPVSETPAIRGTNPERLARMLGTEVTHDEQGNATVSMPDYVPFSTAPRTVSRVDDEVLSDSAPEPASTTPSAPLEGAAPEAAAVDMDAIAETVIDKLRRELLVEREQAGGPMDLI